MGKPTYSELLNSPLWQKKRLEILQRDDWTCQWCGETEQQLHVHHKRYGKNKAPWDYPNTNLVTVCDFCHKRHHFLQWFQKHGLDYLKGSSYDEPDCHFLFHHIREKVIKSFDRKEILIYMRNIEYYLKLGTLVMHLVSDEPAVKKYSAKLNNIQATVTFTKRYPKEDHYGNIWDTTIVEEIFDKNVNRFVFIGQAPSNEDAVKFFYLNTRL